MPEGPTILNYSQQIQQFKGKKVSEVSGYGPMDKSLLENMVLKDISTYGKYLIFQFKDFFVTAHFGLFGSMLVNERKDVNASFALHFAKGELNFYVTRTKLYNGKAENTFDFRTDIMRKEFEPKYVYELMVEHHLKEEIGDVLMNQKVFSGVGNIIRVESLFRSKIHPQSKVQAISKKNLKELIKITKEYGKEFLDEIPFKTVKTSTLVYGKAECPIHHIPLEIETLGKVNRKTYWCKKCQKLS